MDRALGHNDRVTQSLLRRAALIVIVLAVGPRLASLQNVSENDPKVTTVRTPNDGIQPQLATDSAGTTHLIYFTGDPAHGDLSYVRMDRDRHFSDPIRINAQPGSALATGTVRGAQIAVGRDGRVHIAWHGSDTSGGAQAVLYTRSIKTGAGFESERNVATFTTGIDGSAIAADAAGNVYVVWHGGAPGVTDEGARRVWMARSTDDGASFARETAVSDAATGACGCCGVRAFADRFGDLFILYRSAREIVHRDTFLLTSRDHGSTFRSQMLHEWNVGACPMSTFALTQTSNGVLAAWETAGQVYWNSVEAGTGRISTPIPATGVATNRKHPVIARNSRGETLLAWTEGTGWNRGGAVAWQLFDKDGKPTAQHGRADGVPAWGSVAIAGRQDGGFVIIY